MMIKFKLVESDFQQKWNNDNYELRCIFNKKQMQFIIDAVNNHPDNQIIECSDCGVSIKGKLRYNGYPICSKCLKEREEIEA